MAKSTDKPEEEFELPHWMSWDTVAVTDGPLKRLQDAATAFDAAREAFDGELDDNLQRQIGKLVKESIDDLDLQLWVDEHDGTVSFTVYSGHLEYSRSFDFVEVMMDGLRHSGSDAMPHIRAAIRKVDELRLAAAEAKASAGASH